MNKHHLFKKIYWLPLITGMAAFMINACSDESFWKIEPETNFTITWQTPDGQASPPPCPVTLTNTTNTRGLITTYDWTINGVHIATSKDATYTFDASESYTIKLTATNRNTSQSKENIVAIPEMKVSGITISPSENISIEAGKTITLTATVTPADAANKTITWNSLNADIATVNAQSGVVTGISAGTATIRATAADGSGVTATKNVTVTPEIIKVTGITISPSSAVTVEAGKTTTLTATVSPSNASNRNVTWSSLNTGTATVNAQTGVVTGISAGTATIRAAATDGSGITADKSVTVTPVPNLSVSPTSYNFTASGGTSSTITVTSNQSWTVSSNASWLTTSRTSGSNNNTFTMTATANTSTSTARNATVSVTGGGITKTISVTQDKANAPELSVSPTNYNFTSSGGTSSTITVTSNQSWTVSSNASWLTTSRTSGSNNNTFTMTATANSSTSSARNATVTVTGGGISKTISVTQEKTATTNTPVLSVSLSDYNFSANGGTSSTITISSNQSWTISSNASWLTTSRTNGSNNNTFTMTASANSSTTTSRSATVTVSGGGITRTINVTQDIATPTPVLTVSHSDYNFSARGGTSSTIIVTSNQSWTVKSNASWLTTSRSSGSNDNTFTMTASANSSTSSSRSATLTVVGGGITKTISVTQNKITQGEPEMVLVQGGTFLMGCTNEQESDCKSDETPTHNVTLNSFYIGKFEITQAQWQAIMSSNPSFFKGDNFPVVAVSWNDIVGTSGNFEILNGIKYYENGFIYKLNAATGKKYRLPTEAEWEYAARGGNQSRGYKYSGSNTLDNVAWHVENSGGTHEVGTKQANELGIYDMSGNVCELCQDWLGSYSNNSQTNPQGPPSGFFRVCRGGCWLDDDLYRVSSRSGSTQEGRGNHRGFRVALSD